LTLVCIYSILVSSTRVHWILTTRLFIVHSDLTACMLNSLSQTMISNYTFPTFRWYIAHTYSDL